MSRLALARLRFSIGSLLFTAALHATSPALATVFDWDNFGNNSNFNDAVNWLPGGGPPGAGDTAIFDGQLQGTGIGNNTVNVADGTAINDLQIFNSVGFPATVVDLTIGDGTTASRFDLDNTFGNSFSIGNSPSDTATLNLLGGRLDTFDAAIVGDTTLNVINPGSLWDSTDVVVSSGAGTSVAGPGIGLGLNAQIVTHGNLVVGNDFGSGRVVVDGGGLGSPALWSIDGALDVGPPTMPDRSFASVLLSNGGRMAIGSDVNIHPGNFTNRITVESGGNLDVTGSLNVLGPAYGLGPFAGLRLRDSTSSITTGDIDFDGPGFEQDWTGGTLHITHGRVRIDDSPFADLRMDNLTIDSGMTLKVTRVTGLADSLTIGNVGTGQMTVQNGGVVESYNGYIGEATSADGTVNVTGSPSRWTVNEDLVVGFEDSTVGRLNVNAGGQVSANSIYLGQRDTADGTVTVNNGTLTSTAVLAVGGSIADDETGPAAGGTGQLTVQNEGSIDVEKTLIVFGGGAVNLTGVRSQITADEIRLEPGASFTAALDTAVVTNHLIGFGNNANFSNLQIGHSGGSALGSHTVGPGETLSVGSNLTVGLDAVGSLSINGGTLFSGPGDISFLEGAAGSRVDIDGSGAFWFAEFINVGKVIAGGLQAAGSLTISNDAQVITTGELYVNAPGTVTLDSGIISASVVFVDGELRGNGAIIVDGGSGSLLAFNNRGLVSPGLSAGVITINGSAVIGDTYIQEAIGGRLLIEIGGTSPFQHDRLNVVDGSASLDGVLDVVLIDPVGGSNIFVPKAGDAFEILTADGGLGGTTFTTENLPDLGGGIFFDVLYDATLVQLAVAGIPGDYNYDGTVDAIDYTTWRDSLGQTGTALSADGDASGSIDENDYLVWKTNFGMTASAALQAVSSSTQVPEPATFWWLVAMVTGATALSRSHAYYTLPGG
ncbi:MAG: beta strand repeat-containing protein [Aeoliella sp.]